MDSNRAGLSTHGKENSAIGFQELTNVSAYRYLLIRHLPRDERPARFRIRPNHIEVSNRN